ncbi:hypothetical protein LNQ03_08465 [Klebsiella pneumoniae subsp. pneumoniae]|nr:hypothetical protein [Klebsiella pneumoniae subsp. pneumoniae]
MGMQAFTLAPGEYWPMRAPSPKAGGDRPPQRKGYRLNRRAGDLTSRLPLPNSYRGATC